MKKIVAVLLCVMLSAMAVSALAVSRKEADEIARQATGGQVYKTERDDGVFEVKLRSNTTVYEVDVRQSDGAVLKIEEKAMDMIRAREFVLTEEQVLGIVTAKAPDAQVGPVIQERDDGSCYYEVLYADGEALVQLKLNGQTGMVDERTTWPEALAGGGKTPAEAAQIAQDHVAMKNGKVTEMSVDTERGGYVYEVELRVGASEYSFEIDAATGKVVDWERD